MRNKCSWFSEAALFFCSTVTGDAFPDPRGRNKRREVWTCRCDWLPRYLQLYNGRRTVKNSFTKYNIHSICDWGGLLKDKFVIWQYSLVLPRCSCIFIRSKEYTSLIRYNTPGIYSVVRHTRKRKLDFSSFTKEKWQMPDRCAGDGHAWNWCVEKSDLLSIFGLLHLLPLFLTNILV